MSCPVYTKFNNVDSLGNKLVLEQIEDNLKSFLDWGLLNIGGFVNVNIPTTGIAANFVHQLKQSNDPGFANGKVWQTTRKDWVWETGVEYNNYSPNIISGIYINNIFSPAPTGSGSYGYYIDYPNGRVVFNNAFSNANMSMSYSYRWCQVHKSSSSPWWVELQGDLTSPNPQFAQKDKGNFNIPAKHRIQMPCIVIEPTSRSELIPWQLGATNFMVNQDFLLHIFTERAHDKNKLVDIIRLQKEKTIILYDSTKLISSGIYGINANGSKNINGKIYPDIVSDTNFIWKRCFFKDTAVMDMETANNTLFWCTIRLTTETLL
jgi:hypothetical protein